jgi:hypothetical protein
MNGSLGGKNPGGKPAGKPTGGKGKPGRPTGGANPAGGTKGKGLAVKFGILLTEVAAKGLATPGTPPPARAAGLNSEGLDMMHRHDNYI